jgi:formylmethanofuran dehydrogenase subunit E-like metal-binding protein
MIVNMALKRIADFHGHVCPDLVLGSKFCEYIQKLLPSNKFARAFFLSFLCNIGAYSALPWAISV